MSIPDDLRQFVEQPSPPLPARDAEKLLEELQEGVVGLGVDWIVVLSKPTKEELLKFTDKLVKLVNMCAEGME